MATKKVTVTMTDDQLEQIRALVEAGRASSVSGFVQHAVTQALDDVAVWAEMLTAALDETGGPLTEEEREWVDSILDQPASRPTPHPG